MIVAKLTQKDANNVSCDECDCSMEDDDGLELDFGVSIQVALCSVCKKELIDKIVRLQ